ncbi:hypothetical protein E2562_008713 [Oryza meyeriana var. granulata]|uniref:SAC domain-containing protein n=1 Tax=Oryza meyeriana var. granulata TaxID=110450 RepID=A0A6G1F5T9_9ORYZ|nr:hypothetical protein E2562_008713 [Oryza meyeriana var. granulata]
MPIPSRPPPSQPSIRCFDQSCAAGLVRGPSLSISVAWLGGWGPHKTHGNPRPCRQPQQGERAARCVRSRALHFFLTESRPLDGSGAAVGYGKRSTQGILNDLWNSLARYYLNNFADGTKQDAMDLLQGHYITSVNRDVEGPSKAGLLENYAVGISCVYFSRICPCSTHLVSAALGDKSPSSCSTG